MTGSPDKRTRVLVVSLPGMMQKMLRETFNSRLNVDLVGVASGGLSAVRMIQQKQPHLVVIDSNLPSSEASALIVWMKEECHQVCSLVLAETTQQLNRATAAGADIVMRSYSLVDNLDSVFVNMSAIHTSTSVEKTDSETKKEK
jgi:chemotaxis response regulator CheB